MLLMRDFYRTCWICLCRSTKTQCHAIIAIKQPCIVIDINAPNITYWHEKGWVFIHSPCNWRYRAPIRMSIPTTQLLRPAALQAARSFCSLTHNYVSCKVIRAAMLFRYKRLINMRFHEYTIKNQ